MIVPPANDILCRPVFLQPCVPVKCSCLHMYVCLHCVAVCVFAFNSGLYVCAVLGFWDCSKCGCHSNTRNRPTHLGPKLTAGTYSYDPHNLLLCSPTVFPHTLTTCECIFNICIPSIMCLL